MQPPVPPPPAPSGCAALGLRSMSCAAFSLIILYIVLLPLLLLFVRVRTLHARGERLDFKSLLGAPHTGTKRLLVARNLYVRPVADKRACMHALAAQNDRLSGQKVC